MQESKTAKSRLDIWRLAFIVYIERDSRENLVSYDRMNSSTLVVPLHMQVGLASWMTKNDNFGFFSLLYRIENTHKFVRERQICRLFMFCFTSEKVLTLRSRSHSSTFLSV